MWVLRFSCRVKLPLNLNRIVILTPVLFETCATILTQVSKMMKKLGVEDMSSVDAFRLFFRFLQKPKVCALMFIVDGDRN